MKKFQMKVFTANDPFEMSRGLIMMSEREKLFFNGPFTKFEEFFGKHGLGSGND